jgi:hypothetical protein
MQVGEETLSADVIPFTLTPSKDQCPRCCPQRNSQKTVLFVTEIHATSIAIGWRERVSGRDFHSLKSSAFDGALFHQSPGVPPTCTGQTAKKSCYAITSVTGGFVLGVFGVIENTLSMKIRASKTKDEEPSNIFQRTASSIKTEKLAATQRPHGTREPPPEERDSHPGQGYYGNVKNQGQRPLKRL